MKRTVKIQKVQELLAQYEERRRSIVDPDNSSWEDIGFEEAPEGYASPLEYLEGHGELDEAQQTELALLGEIIEDMKKLIAFG